MSTRSSRPPRTRSGAVRALRVLVVAATVAVGGPTLVPEVVAATSVDDARRRVEQIVDELERLAARSDRLTEDYAVAVDDKNRLDAEILESEARVASMAAQLDELRGELSDLAVRSFTGAGTDVLGPLFTSAEKYNDGLQRDQYARVALSVGATTADDYAALETEYRDALAVLERQRVQAEALTEQISSSLTEAESLRSEYQQRRAAAEAELQGAIAAEEQRRAEESYRRMLAEAEAEAAAARAAAAPRAPTGGGNSPNPGGNSGTSGGDNSGNAGNPGGSAPAPNPAPAPAPAPAPNYPQPSSLSQVAVNAAMSQQGVPYRFATSLPGVSFDCSGLTHYAWAQAGVYLPRNSRMQFAATPRVPSSEARPGDLVFFYNPISHVGLYIGGGQMVHAPNTGSVVHVRSVNWGNVVGVGRPG